MTPLLPLLSGSYLDNPDKTVVPPGTVPSTVLPLPDSDHAVATVVYYTSLHIIRRTYDDCRSVRSILLDFVVASINERFREELQRILRCQNVSLPSVFVGGADDVRKLYDSSQL
ncbi:hypothetical protein E2542_SST00496 [Spatholobus suberectus]|nr:hypothetical protein E2542_SST00496 [Spatholobus suberectus]